eukprot:c46095_g1_i1 orf=91-267(+)
MENMLSEICQQSPFQLQSWHDISLIARSAMNHSHGVSKEAMRPNMKPIKRANKHFQAK